MTLTPTARSALRLPELTGPACTDGSAEPKPAEPKPPPSSAASSRPLVPAGSPSKSAHKPQVAVDRVWPSGGIEVDCACAWCTHGAPPGR
jgi:hypothetical protein